MPPTSEIRTTLDLARGGLRFLCVETEREYRSWQTQLAIPFVRSVMTAAVVVWLVTLAVGAALLLITSGGSPAIRVVVVAIPALVVAWASAYLWAIARRPSLRDWVLPSMVVNCAIAGSLMVATAFRFDLPELAMAAVVTISFFVSTILRPRFTQTLVSLVPFVALNQLLLLQRLGSKRIDLVMFALQSLAAANAVVIALFANAAIDRASRESFRRDRIIELQQLAIAREAERADVAERARQLSEALLRLSGPQLPPSMLRPGDIVEEQYQIVRTLGHGGMGEVHEVERLKDGRHLALKVLRGSVDRPALARFAREAHIAAQLDHPNVVAVRDVGVSPSGMLFIVMDLVAGSTLAAERSRYGDAAWALPLLRQIVAALAALHARGIVHRDLKPANVLFDGAAAKVTDFGLAFIGMAEETLDGSAPTVARVSPAAITGTGAIIGTPLYMAPELTHGIRLARPAADVWSFGVMTHELLTGSLPFTESPLAALLAGRSTAVTPLAAPSLSESLRALLDACLRTDPDERPDTATLRDAFDAERARV